MADTKDILGRGWSFPPTFSKGLDGVEMLGGVDDIESSLEILLSTRVGERVMQPRYGCNLDQLLFEPLTKALNTYMKDLIETSVTLFEPRIKLDSVEIEENRGEGIVKVLLEYTVMGTNSRYNFVFPFYKEEANFIVGISEG